MSRRAVAVGKASARVERVVHVARRPRLQAELEGRDSLSIVLAGILARMSEPVGPIWTECNGIEKTSAYLPRLLRSVLLSSLFLHSPLVDQTSCSTERWDSELYHLPR